jgi:hypothetical protein
MTATVAQLPTASGSHPAPEVLRCDALARGILEAFVAGCGMQLRWIGAAQVIPGSYWGESEAGLLGDRLCVRPDTPVHSALHELCHWLCMTPQRRAMLDTDAGGEDVEEHAVCYLQCLLADQLPGYSRARCFADMDAWGYSFILGSARAFFERDCDDAQAFLLRHGLIDAGGRASGHCRAT